MRTMNCDQVHDVAAELALGALSGETRGAAIAHLEGCARCREEVSSLSDAADLLLLAAPRVDPPAGFETRVLALIEAEQRDRDWDGAAEAVVAPHRSGLRRGPLAWAVRVSLVAATAALIVVARPVGELEETASAEMRTATGAVVGRALIDGDRPAEITLEMPGWSTAVADYGSHAEGLYWAAVERSDGTTSLVALPQPDGSTWRVPLGDNGAADVVSIAVVDSSHRAWCSARFDA
jgi:hypothetical protein